MVRGGEGQAMDGDEEEVMWWSVKVVKGYRPSKCMKKSGKTMEKEV